MQNKDAGNHQKIEVERGERRKLRLHKLPTCKVEAEGDTEERLQEGRKGGRATSDRHQLGKRREDQEMQFWLLVVDKYLSMMWSFFSKENPTKYNA